MMISSVEGVQSSQSLILSRSIDSSHFRGLGQNIRHSRLKIAAEQRVQTSSQGNNRSIHLFLIAGLSLLLAIP